MRSSTVRHVPRSGRAVRSAAALAMAAALAVTAGCGQKAGVAGTLAGSGGAGAAVAANGGVPGAAVDANGMPLPAGAAGAGATGGDLASGGTATGAGAGTTGGTTAAGGTAPGAGGGQAAVPGASGSAAASGPGDATGVTDTTIKIGVHAPVTGAAAIPQQSFQRAVGVYFDAVNRAGGINGRKVDVIFKDDGFDPNRARTECKRLAEQEKVFLLIGGAGADQIDACARYASAMGVPYLSAGVHETRPGLGSLGSLPTYFALSLTYEQQVPLLVRTAKQAAGSSKVALIVADNDSLNNFYTVAEAGLKSAFGANLALARRIPKNTTSDAPAIATNICQSGAKVVVWNASPSTMLNVAKSMACTVTFVGPGLTNGLNIVTQVGCPNVNGALFYSPFPGMDVMRGDGAFVQAYKNKNGGSNPDDIGAAMYGMEKLVGEIIRATGKDLTRQSFMATIGKVKTFTTGVYPPTNFRSRFGGTAMNLLKADCGKSEYVTVRRNERP
ncbi:MAG TPA: ABC transporter substrate-binding protein [Nonomuraea sp.]|nr:ABC transporter substrate-binding protein [Nonomuraea sp.]